MTFLHRANGKWKQENHGKGLYFTNSSLVDAIWTKVWVWWYSLWVVQSSVSLPHFSLSPEPVSRPSLALSPPPQGQSCNLSSERISWILDTGAPFGLNESLQFPPSENSSHWWSSCSLFYDLIRQYSAWFFKWCKSSEISFLSLFQFIQNLRRDPGL